MVAIAACRTRLRSRRVGSKSEAVTSGIFPAVRSSLVKARSGFISTIADSRNNVNGKVVNSNTHEAIALGYSTLYSRTSMRRADPQQQVLEPGRQGRIPLASRSRTILYKRPNFRASAAGLHSATARTILSLAIRCASRESPLVDAKVIDDRIVVQTESLFRRAASYSSLTDGVHPQSADIIVEGNSGPPPACEIIEGQPYRFDS